MTIVRIIVVPFRVFLVCSRKMTEYGMSCFRIGTPWGENVQAMPAKQDFGAF